MRAAAEGAIMQEPAPPGWRARLAANPVLRPALGMGAGSVAVSSLTLLTGALTARLLGPEGRGDLLILTLYPLIASNLLILGLDVALARISQRHGMARRTALAAAFAATGSATLVAGAALALGSAVWDGHAVNLLAAMAPAALILFASSHLSMLYQSLVIAEQDYQLYTRLRLAMPLVVLAGVLACFALGAGLEWVMIAVVAGALAYPVSALARWRAAGPGVPGWRHEPRLWLGYAGPAAALHAARSVEAQAVGLAVTLLGTRAEAGLCAAALVAASVVAMLSEGLSRYAFGAALKAEVGSAADFRIWFRQVRRTALVLLLLSLACAGPVVWFLVPYVYGAEFAPARALVLPLMAGSTLAAMANLYTEIARAHGLSRLAIGPRLAAATLVFGIAAIGIPGLDFLGTLCAAFVAAQAVQLVLLHRAVAARLGGAA